MKKIKIMYKRPIYCGTVPVVWVKSIDFVPKVTFLPWVRCVFPKDTSIWITGPSVEDSLSPCVIRYHPVSEGCLEQKKLIFSVSDGLGCPAHLLLNSGTFASSATDPQVFEQRATPSDSLDLRSSQLGGGFRLALCSSSLWRRYAVENFKLGIIIWISPRSESIHLYHLSVCLSSNLLFIHLHPSAVFIPYPFFPSIFSTACVSP